MDDRSVVLEDEVSPDVKPIAVAAPPPPPPAPASEPSPKSATSGWPDYLKTILEIGGTGGLFIAAGYIAETAHDELLGVNFPINRTLNDYALSGGRFAIESIAKLWLHPRISAVGIVVIALVLVAGSRVQVSSDRARVPAQVIALCLLIPLFAWKTYRLDVPYIQMEGVLKHPPLREPEAASEARKSWLSFKQHDLWEKFARTHINSVQDEWSNPLMRVFPAFLEPEKECRVSLHALTDLVWPAAEHTCFSIEEEYVIDVIATIALLLITIIFVRSAPAGDRATRSLPGDCRAALRLLVLVAAMASAITLPYIYGKAIESTTFPAGRIAFDSTDFAGAPKIEIADGLVIWADDKFVTMYRSDTFEFLHLSRTRVRYVSAGTAKDIIRVYALSSVPHPTETVTGGP